MTTRDAVKQQFAEDDYEFMVDEIVRLREQLEAVTQERDEDQGVIAVWRGRTERAETRAERMEHITDEMCDQILWELHGYASDIDPYEMGLPMMEYNIPVMRKIIRDTLERKDM